MWASKESFTGFLFNAQEAKQLSRKSFKLSSQVDNNYEGKVLTSKVQTSSFYFALNAHWGYRNNPQLIFH